MSDSRHEEAADLFRNSVVEIDAALSSQNRHDLMRATLPFRQLFLDGYPLIHRINRKYRHSLSFEVNANLFDPFVSENEEGKPLIFALRTSSGYPHDDKTEVQLQELINADCLYYDNRLSGGETYTVLDVVKTCAYIKGGIHFDNPSNLSEERLVELDEQFNIMGHEPSVYILAGVMDTCISSCVQLAESADIQVEWSRCHERFEYWLSAVALHAKPETGKTNRDEPLIRNWKIQQQ